jgi:hypothetical protein
MGGVWVVFERWWRSREDGSEGMEKEDDMKEASDLMGKEVEDDEEAKDSSSLTGCEGLVKGLEELSKLNGSVAEPKGPPKLFMSGMSFGSMISYDSRAEGECPVDWVSEGGEPADTDEAAEASARLVRVAFLTLSSISGRFFFGRPRFA